MSAFEDFFGDALEWLMGHVLMPLLVIGIVAAVVVGSYFGISAATERATHGECVAVDPVEVLSVGHASAYTTYVKSGDVMIPITSPERWWANTRGARSKSGKACSVSVSIAQGQYDDFIKNGVADR